MKKSLSLIVLGLLLVSSILVSAETWVGSESVFDTVDEASANSEDSSLDNFFGSIYFWILLVVFLLILFKVFGGSKNKKRLGKAKRK